MATNLRHEAGLELLDRLRRLESAARLALRALTEGMADVPVERDFRCAALRVKAKRALRETLGFALEEEDINGEEILRRLEEAEARCAALRAALEKIHIGCCKFAFPAKAVNYALDIAGEALEMSDAGRDLVNRLRKLEAVAEAARKIWGEVRDQVKGDFWVEIPPDWEGWEQLERALAALEEVNDES